MCFTSFKYLSTFWMVNHILPHGMVSTGFKPTNSQSWWVGHSVGYQNQTITPQLTKSTKTRRFTTAWKHFLYVILLHQHFPVNYSYIKTNCYIRPRFASENIVESYIYFKEIRVMKESQNKLLFNLTMTTRIW